MSLPWSLTATEAPPQAGPDGAPGMGGRRPGRLPAALVDLRLARLGEGLTQSELGRRTGVLQNYVSRIETGDAASPRLTTLELLASALGLEIRALPPVSAPEGCCRNLEGGRDDPVFRCSECGATAANAVGVAAAGGRGRVASRGPLSRCPHCGRLVDWDASAIVRGRDGR